MVGLFLVDSGVSAVWGVYIGLSVMVEGVVLGTLCRVVKMVFLWSGSLI